MTDEVGQSLSGWRDGDRDALLRQFGDRPVWGIVSMAAMDSFYAGLTYAQAIALARDQVESDFGRDAVIVLLIERLIGRPVMSETNAAEVQHD